MSVNNFDDLIEHVNHKIEIAIYKDQKGEPVNVAIECLDCNEVLLDYDKDEE